MVGNPAGRSPLHPLGLEPPLVHYVLGRLYGPHLVPSRRLQQRSTFFLVGGPEPVPPRGPRKIIPLPEAWTL